jgi:hypothetical protein
MGHMTFKIALPFNSLVTRRSPRVTWVDIETRKTRDAIGPFWEPILIGMGFRHEDRWFVELNYSWDDKDEWVDVAHGPVADSDMMIYAATREFDEMVLKGRFTNARRAHLPKRPRSRAGISETAYVWANIRKLMAEPFYERDLDVLSKEVPLFWQNSPGDKAVLVHLFRDVLELMVRDPANSLDDQDRRRVAALMSDFKACLRFMNRNEVK